ncbi:MAG: hypothetical protein Q4F41_19070 [Eubacteriales bacterium]|nr:hypothetical protein [Eubacteriales bacterium]
MKNTVYFRFMYQNEKQGIAHTAHITKDDGNESYLMTYFCGCGDGQTVHLNEGTDERFDLCGETIDLMVVDGLGTEAASRVCKLLEKNQVKEILLPERDQALTWLKEGMAEKVTILSEGQTFHLEKAGWETWAHCYGDEEGNSLAVYHGPAAVDPKKTDCLLSVKPFGKELPCGPCVKEGNHACAMRCSLYNDFDLCKKHNDRDSEKYVAGTLLLGNVQLQKYASSLGKELAANENAAGKIRFVTLPAGGNQDYWSLEAISMADPAEEPFNRYFIAPEAAANAEVCKELMASGLRHKVLLCTEKYGVCAGGFFTDRE